MKEYIKPEAEFVEFESEVVTSGVVTEGGDKPFSGDLDEWV